MKLEKNYSFLVTFFVLLSVGAGCTSADKLPGNDNQPADNIEVFLPAVNAVVSNPIHVQGQARVFESQFNWRLLDNSGEILLEGNEMANAPDMGQFGPFDFWIPVPATNNENIVLEVLDYSAKDGAPQDVVRVPLTLERIDQQKIKLFFHNDKLDPTITCVTSFPVEREIVATIAPARVAMMFLLRGPEYNERELSYATVLSAGETKLQALNLKANGEAVVDLACPPGLPIGGSCFVSAVRSEIENTLKQFETVKSVKILIDGEEDRLQP